MKLLRKLAIVTCSAFVVMNIVAYIHAYRFTHFSDSSVARTKDPTQLTAFDKVKVLFMGVDNPRPQHRSTPDTPFDTFFISSSGELECWRINTPDAIGTMIMFHGYAGEKSSLLERAEKFRAMGFNTVLVDFTGSGGSEGNSTTVGFDEARQVKDCYEAISKTDHQIFLFGTSMGAAAILKAMDDYQLPTKACVLECPFGALQETVNARFKMMHVPSFPMATLLTFWGGVQHGYWAFDHNPSSYAKSVLTPTLILYGEQDERVTLQESTEIFNNLKGDKKLITYPDAGHNVFVPKNQSRWENDVKQFLKAESENRKVEK